MNSMVKLNKNESGQAALEAAIILIAFVVVASVFAFAVLSAGSASTARGEQAIYAGLKEVQSSMSIKGAVIAKSDMACDSCQRCGLHRRAGFRWRPGQSVGRSWHP